MNNNKKNRHLKLIIGILVMLGSLCIILMGIEKMINGKEIDEKKTAIWSLTESKTYYKKTDDWYTGLAIAFVGSLGELCGICCVILDANPDLLKKIKTFILPSKPTVKKSKTYSSAADEIKKYKQLLDFGVITPEEYEQQKKKIMEDQEK